jgi:hypothetical protein
MVHRRVLCSSAHLPSVLLLQRQRRVAAGSGLGGGLGSGLGTGLGTGLGLEAFDAL